MQRAPESPSRATGLTRYPVVGHTPAFLSDRLGFLAAAAEGAERAVELRIGRKTFLLVDADEVRHVLVANADAYAKTPRLTSRRGRRVSGSGILTLTGAAHRLHRREIQPGFTQRAVAPYLETIVETASEQARTWAPGEVIDVAEEMTAIARRAIVRMVLGRLVEAEERAVEEAVVWRRRHIEQVFHSLLPAPDRMPNAVNREYRRRRRILDGIMRRRLDEVAREPDGTLLAALARTAGDEASGRRRVLDEALTMLITGHETVGDALAWTWHLLAGHPEVERRLRAELASDADAAEPDRGPGAALPYTWAVICESMRLFPPTWIFVRIAREADTLPTGVRVPRGSKLYVSQWVLHRSPRYFPGPERFDPGRFEPGAARHPRHAYFPFGFGPRVCIGETIARLELLAVTAHLARRFRFVPLPGRLVEPEPAITLRPRGGVPMRIEPAASG